MKRARFTICDVAWQAGVSRQTVSRVSAGAEAGCRQHGFSLISSSVPGEAALVALINGLVSSRLIEGLTWSGWTTGRWPRIAIRR